MEKKLKQLFDFQRFEKNQKLDKMIQETENYYSKELSDKELSFVAAAGDWTEDGNVKKEIVKDNEIETEN